MRFLAALILLFSPFRSSNNATPLALPSIGLQGVDVSHYQDKIDWDAVVAKQPIHFAFVKATENCDYTDSLFCQNWADLRRVGVRRGAYHFFRAYGCGAEQAEHFLKTVDMQPGDLLPVLDIERVDNVPVETMLEEARIWLQIVESRLHCRPIIYSNQFFYEKYLAGQFDDYPLWVARYTDIRPILNTGKNWDIWQYGNDGCLDGICRKVDKNVFYGTPEMLEQRLCWYPKIETAEAAAP